MFDELEDEFARRYDPMFSWIDMKPSPVDEMGSQEMVKSWREGAWRNAERLINARTPEERRRVDDSIEATSVAWAEAIRSAKVPGYRATRDAHCAASTPVALSLGQGGQLVVVRVALDPVEAARPWPPRSRPRARRSCAKPRRVRPRRGSQPASSPPRSAAMTAAALGSGSARTPPSGTRHDSTAAAVRSPRPYSPASSMPAAMTLSSGAPTAAYEPIAATAEAAAVARPSPVVPVVGLFDQDAAPLAGVRGAVAQPTDSAHAPATGRRATGSGRAGPRAARDLERAVERRPAPRSRRGTRPALRGCDGKPP